MVNLKSVLVNSIKDLIRHARGAPPRRHWNYPKLKLATVSRKSEDSLLLSAQFDKGRFTVTHSDFLPDLLAVDKAGQEICADGYVAQSAVLAP